MYENFGWKYALTGLIVILWGFALFSRDIPRGLDLRGGDEIIYRLDFGGKAPTAKVTEDAVAVMRERIDVLGVKELTIRSLGVDKIVVQVPGSTQSETDKIKAQIERAGQLAFKILITDQVSANAKANLIKSIVREKERGTWKEETARYDVAEWAEGSRGGDGGQYALMYHRTPGSGKPEFVDGSLLLDANRAMDDRGRPCVGFTWNSVGRKRFYSLTEKNTGKNLAVVLDGKIRSAPVIRTAIGKRGIIEGGDKGWDEKELNNLIVILKAGSLPAKPILAYQKKVGAQLGQQAVKLGGFAIVGALIVVMIFMVIYYRVRSGVIADIALALNLFLILGTLSMFDATLTLPGVAGILLTAGMAVDANILIFERIREEIARGAAVKQAIQSGYDRAFWTIFDANLTTALTAAVLMWVGTGPIKGFGLTLTIGIVVSMFTALFVTRALFGFFVVRGLINDVSYRELFKKPTFDFFKSHKKALTCSLVFIAIGWLVFIGRGDDKYGIDFTGGTVLAMRLKTPLEKADVEKRIREHFKAKGDDVTVEVQRLGEIVPGGVERGREWQLRTRRVESDTSTSATPANKTSLLDVILPSAHGQDAPPPVPGDDTKTKTAEAPPPAKTEEAPPPAKTEEGPPPAKTEEGPPPAKTEEGPPPAKTEEGPPPAKTDAAPPPAKTDAAPPPAKTAAVAPPPAQPAATPAAAPARAAGSQDYFEQQVREAFKAELVAAYPALNGKPYEVVADKGGKVRLKFRVDMVKLSDKEPSAELIRSELPKLFRQLAKKLDAKKNAQRIKDLRALAGDDGEGTGFLVEALMDEDKEDGVYPFVVSTSPVERVAPAIHQRMLEAFKEGMEKVQDFQAPFAPARPFPNIDTVGSAVAKNLKSKALIATFFCVVFICLYVWLRFDFWSGIAAIVAVFHDVLCLLGFLAILDFLLSKAGLHFDVKFSLTTISAFLTLVGYSINDTIVVLDRIREDKHLAKSKIYTPELVNEAINKTLMRTVLTSLTTFLVCGVLFVVSFGGLASIQGLSVALLFGIAVGTYSSVFIAAPILLVDKKKVSITLYAVFCFLVLSGMVFSDLHPAAKGGIAVCLAVMPAVFMKLFGSSQTQLALEAAKKDTGKKA